MFQRTASYSVPAHNGHRSARRTSRRSRPTTPRSAPQNSLMPTAIGSRLPIADSFAARGRTPKTRESHLRDALGARRAAVPRRVPRSALRPERQRDRGRVRRATRSAGSSQDPAVAELLVAEDRDRLQAAVRRHRLLRDVQPRQRRARRRERDTDHGDHAARPARRRSRVRVRLHRVRHRIRRDDRRAVAHRHPRPRRRAPARRVGGGPAHLSRARLGRVPQPLHHLRARAARRCSPT